MPARDQFGNLVDADVVIVCRFLEVGGLQQLQDLFRSDGRQQIVDSFSLSDVPRDERHVRSAGPQFARQKLFGEANLLVLILIRVKTDDHSAASPSDEVEIRDHTLYVASVAVRTSSHADDPAPVPNTP